MWDEYQYLTQEFEQIRKEILGIGEGTRDEGCVPLSNLGIDNEEARDLGVDGNDIEMSEAVVVGQATEDMKIDDPGDDGEEEKEKSDLPDRQVCFLNVF